MFLNTLITGEKERKMVKEIVKRARDPVKARTINADVVDKYKNKLKKIEEDIQRVLEEEKAEREIAKLENRAGHLQNRIDGQKDDDRQWFQTKQQRKEEKERLRQQRKDPTNTKTKQKKKNEKILSKDPAEAKEMRKLQNEADYITRQAKAKRKLTKLRVVKDDDHTPNNKKRKGNKSSFDDALVNTSTQNVKKFRHIANQKKNEDRRNAKKKGNVKSSKSSFK